MKILNLLLLCAAVLQNSSPSYGRDLAVLWRCDIDEANQQFQPGPLVSMDSRLFCCVAQFNKVEPSKWKMEFRLWEFDSAGQRIRDILLHASERIFASPLPSRVQCFASSKAKELYAVVRQGADPLLLIKISETLEVVYKKSLFGKDTTARTIQFLPNDNFILTGREKKKGILVELNPSGEILRTKEFLKEGMSCICSDFRMSTDNNVMLTVCSDLKTNSVSIHKLNDAWDVLKSEVIPSEVYAYELFEMQFLHASSNKLALFSPSHENDDRKNIVKTYNADLEATTEINMAASGKLFGFCRAKPFDNETVAIASESASGVTMYLLHNDGQEETHLKITDRCSDIHTWIESSDGRLWLVTRTGREAESVGRVSVFAIEVKK